MASRSSQATSTRATPWGLHGAPWQQRHGSTVAAAPLIQIAFAKSPLGLAMWQMEQVRVCQQSLLTRGWACGSMLHIRMCKGGPPGGGVVVATRVTACLVTTARRAQHFAGPREVLERDPTLETSGLPHPRATKGRGRLTCTCQGGGDYPAGALSHQRAKCLAKPQKHGLMACRTALSGMSDL